MVFSPETMSGSVSNLNKGIDVDFKEMFDLPIYNRYFILRGQ